MAWLSTSFRHLTEFSCRGKGSFFQKLCSHRPATALKNEKSRRKPAAQALNKKKPPIVCGFRSGGRFGLAKKPLDDTFADLPQKPEEAAFCHRVGGHQVGGDFRFTVNLDNDLANRAPRRLKVPLPLGDPGNHFGGGLNLFLEHDQQIFRDHKVDFTDTTLHDFGFADDLARV